MNTLYTLIPFTIKHGNCGGSLIQFQPGAGPENALPFSIAKVLYMTDIAPDDVRGRHAHHRTQEIAVCLEGACTFELDDGRGRRERIRLDRPELAILLPPRVWRVYCEFAPGHKNARHCRYAVRRGGLYPGSGDVRAACGRSVERRAWSIEHGAESGERRGRGPRSEVRGPGVPLSVDD
jgi:hypothetical protein